MIIDFEITQNGYTLRDALVLPDDYVPTDAEIEAIKQQRFNNWYIIITTLTGFASNVGASLIAQEAML